MLRLYQPSTPSSASRKDEADEIPCIRRDKNTVTFIAHRDISFSLFYGEEEGGEGKRRKIRTEILSEETLRIIAETFSVTLFLHAHRRNRVSRPR